MMELEIIPPELRDEYDAVAVMGDRSDCRTVLLRGRDGGLAVLKRISGTFDERVYEAVRALDGDGAPRMLGLYSHGGETYLLREYVEGLTLLETYRRYGPLSAREAAAAGAELCGILERLHGLDPPLIHRDIKAENVVRTPEGRYVLIDFDIARFYDADGRRDTHIMGTGFASAPEQFGFAQTDPRSDIYSVGVLLHEISTGEFDLSKGRTPGRLRRVTAKCTRFDPADRYQSASELKRALLRRHAGAAIGALAALLAALCLLAVLARPKEETYAFASPAIGREAARQLGKDVEDITREDLEWITSMRLVGETVVDDWELIMIHGGEIDINGQAEEGRGTVETLEDIPNFPNLTELVLCNQRISDLTPLEGCRLTALALHGNVISDISPLAECRELQKLIISDNPVTDLTPLTRLERLKELNAGATYIRDLEAIGELRGLTRLELHDCPGILSLEGLEKLTNLDFLSVRPVNVEDMELLGGFTRLTSLYIWSPGYPEDLTALSGLTELRRLYMDIGGLGSLEGIESMKELTHFDFRGNNLRPLDAAPLAGLTELVDVNLDYLCSNTGWSEAEGLKKLRFATISAADETAFRAAVDGRDVVIYVSPG